MRGAALFALASAAYPATLAAQSANETDPAPPFRPLRYDEDWRAWCAARGEAQRKLPKCGALADELLLTIGGDLRERIEAVDDPRFGLVQQNDHVLLHRLLLHADLRAGNSLRGFVQLGYFQSSGRRGAVPATDVNKFDVTQAFIDVAVPVADGVLTVRPGRQEASFGSSRIISVRNGPNARLSFDGIRAIWQKDAVRADAFYWRPVEVMRGALDDASSDTVALWGAHVTAPIAGLGNVDAYYFGYRNERARFANIAGREVRHSFGARLFGKAKGFDWNVEALVQRGNVAGQNIRAWTLASDTGLTFDTKLRPRLGLKANIASGDEDLSDGKLGTFNALFPRFPYFSEASLFAPANFFDVHPTLSVQAASALTLSAEWNRLWRHRRADAIYLSPLVPVAGTAGAPGRRIGDQWIAGIEWRPSPRLGIEAQYVHYRAGATLRRVGGETGDFAMVAVNYRF